MILRKLKRMKGLKPKEFKVAALNPATVMQGLSGNEIDPFDLWNLIKKYFGPNYLDIVLENEYGIMNESVGNSDIVTWSELHE